LPAARGEQTRRFRGEKNQTGEIGTVLFQARAVVAKSGFSLVAKVILPGNADLYGLPHRN